MGRWNPMINEIKKEKRGIRSSYDHCIGTTIKTPKDINNN